MVFCDIGNTHIKFKQSNNIYICKYDDILPKFDEKIFYISVSKAGENVLKNNYKDIENMSHDISFDSDYVGWGVDRAVVCSYIADGIVVDAGTAITVDSIADSHHMGGFILPGITAYKTIYAGISDELNTKQNFDIKSAVLPMDTDKAITYGIVQSIVQPIKNIAKDDTIYITGGDGELLSRFIKGSIYIENLLLDNLEKIKKEKLCSQ